jgi:hypothetical protein
MEALPPPRYPHKPDAAPLSVGLLVSSSENMRMPPLHKDPAVILLAATAAAMAFFAAYVAM